MTIIEKMLTKSKLIKIESNSQRGNVSLIGPTSKVRPQKVLCPQFFMFYTYITYTTQCFLHQ